MTRFDFAGKVAFVTGSSRGLGAAILEAFGNAGATCLVNYFPDAAGENRRDAEGVAECIRTGGQTAHLIEGDVSSFESAERMFAQIKDAAGQLDVLVNNAGVLRDKTIKRMTPDDWRAVLSTNLDGVFHCSKLAAEMLGEGGRIVNIASIAGIVGFHGQANYAAAKAGVIALTKVLAKELARKGVTVNAVAPGVIRTPMLAGIKAEVLDEYVKQIPVGRLGEPADVANAVLFLASADSGYITGQTLPITGGWF